MQVFHCREIFENEGIKVFLGLDSSLKKMILTANAILSFKLLGLRKNINLQNK